MGLGSHPPAVPASREGLPGEEPKGMLAGQVPSEALAGSGQVCHVARRPAAGAPESEAPTEAGWLLRHWWTWRNGGGS